MSSRRIAWVAWWQEWGTLALVLAIVLLAGVVRLIVPLSALAVHGNPQVFFSPDTNSYVRPAQALVEHGSFTTTPGRSVEKTCSYLSERHSRSMKTFSITGSDARAGIGWWIELVPWCTTRDLGQ